MSKFRQVNVSIRSLCAAAVSLDEGPSTTLLSLDIIASWMERKLSDQELEDVLLTYKEDMREEVRAKLLNFKEKYLWDST